MCHHVMCYCTWDSARSFVRSSPLQAMLCVIVISSTFSDVPYWRQSHIVCSPFRSILHGIFAFTFVRAPHTRSHHLHCIDRAPPSLPRGLVISVPLAPAHALRSPAHPPVRLSYLPP